MISDLGVIPTDLADILAIYHIRAEVVQYQRMDQILDLHSL